MALVPHHQYLLLLLDVRFDTDNEYGGETGDYWERFDAPIDAYNPRQGILLWVDTYLIFDNMSTTANSGHTLLLLLLME